MVPKNYFIQREGRVVSASGLAEPVRDLAKFLGLRVGPGLRMRTWGGRPTFERTDNPKVTARLIADTGSGVYTWQGIFRSPTGSPWQDLPAKVSDNGGLECATEYNGNTTLVAGTRVDLERNQYTGQYMFQLDKCS